MTCWTHEYFILHESDFCCGTYCSLIYDSSDGLVFEQISSSSVVRVVQCVIFDRKLFESKVKPGVDRSRGEKNLNVLIFNFFLDFATNQKRMILILGGVGKGKRGL